MDIDEVLVDDDFKIKLERQQTSRSNVEATSEVKGGAGSSQAKNTPEYWLAKGTPPSASDVPDRKTYSTLVEVARRNINVGKFVKTNNGLTKKFNWQYQCVTIKEVEVHE